MAVPNIHIRPETPADYALITQLLLAAFQNEAHSDRTEHLLVARLRQSPAFVPALSLVALQEGQIVGYILLTKISIFEEEKAVHHPSLALAPVAVWPSHHGQGIGGQLIRYAHKKAVENGFTTSVLLGHAKYYPRFGYEMTQKYDIELPFDAPPANCMVAALRPNALQGVRGKVIYPAAFFV